MKKSTRVLSLLLALVLAVSCLGLGAMAATEDNVKQYDSMLAFGSSISRGCGLDGYDDYYNPDAINGLQGSYITMVADACGVPKENRRFCTFQGTTLSAMLTLMGLQEPEVDPLLSKDIWFGNTIFPAIQSFFGKDTPLHLMGEDGSIAKSELITVEIGMSDIFYRSKEISGFVDAISGNGDIATAALSMVGYMWQAYTYLLENYPVLLGALREQNPKAEIVIVSLFNLYSDTFLSDEILLPIGTAASVITGSLNEYLKDLADQYDCKFADVTNVGTPASEKNMKLMSDEFLGNMNINSHPSVENGLPFMARQVLSVLPEKIPTVENKANIVIDLGNVRSVSSVTVNGVPETNYRLNDTVLTVPRLVPGSRIVTVTGTNDQGKVVLNTYQVIYKHGYSVYRIFGLNDAPQAVTGFLTYTYKIAEKAMTTLKGLFK